MKIAAAAIMAFTLISVILLAIAALGLSAARRARLRGRHNAASDSVPVASENVDTSSLADEGEDEGEG